MMFRGLGGVEVGQYFVLVNVTKREYVEGGSKLWEWLANNEARLLCWLVAKAPMDGTGMCQFEPELKKAEEMYFNAKNEVAKEMALRIISRVAMTPLGKGKFKTVGRWAGDEIYLVGDYDDSGLYHEAKATYKNITREVIEEFNEFIELESCKVGRSAHIRPDLVIKASH